MIGLSLVGHAECYLKWHAETADYRRNHTRYRLSVAPEASESKATHKNMYKFREITLTKKESSRRYIQASRVCFCVFREFCVR